MFSYNLSLAIASLKQRPGLTFLIILTIAVGLGLYTTVQTMSFHSGRVPIPHKSENIYLIQMDNRELNAEPIDQQLRMVDTSYKDLMNLLALELPGVTHSFNWNTYGVLNVEDPNIPAVRTRALVTNHQFFSMYEAPFLYGNGWDNSVDNSGEAVIVISREMNDRLFGGENSVGRTLRINTTLMKVVGVMDTWHLSRRFYDRSFSAGYMHEFFIPYRFALDQNLPRLAGFDCWANEAEAARQFREQGLEQLLASECAWISLWAEIPDDQLENYQNQLVQYIESQKRLGRFPREIQTYVTNINEQIDAVDARNGYINVFQMIAKLFFAVCLLNAIGIMLAKFVRRSKEVSLRRALGARKSAIINQYMLEVVMIGVIGGVLGIIISYFGLQGMLNIRLYSSDYTLTAEDISHLYRLNWPLITEALITSIVCTLVVSLYPIWRLCNTPPASQLKSA